MTFIATLKSKIASKQMLDHPFYQRWNRGELSKEELQNYAREYYHFTLAFPTFVSGVHANCDDITVRQALLENLIEEERGPENHPELWLRFCDALGVDRDEVKSSEPSDKTRHLIDVMRNLTRDGSVHEGLAALYAYESQIPAVAQSKIDGLEKFYEIKAARDISFFTVHRHADVLHSQTSEELMTSMCDSKEMRDEASHATEAALSAMYEFLDGVNSNAMAAVVN
jgi:pyrroloquinoline-quinone synthase